MLTAIVQSGKPLVIVAVDVEGESLVWAATFFLSANSKEQKHNRHFRHYWKHPRGPFLGQARGVDFPTPEEARGCRRSASRSSRLSDAVLRSASNAGHAGPPALQERGRAEMDCRDRALRRLRLRHPRVQLRTLRGAQERARLG